MPRSPLFSLVRRSLRLSHASLRDPRPVREMLEETAHQLSRREFLKATAVLGAAGVIGCVSARRPEAQIEPVASRARRTVTSPVIVVSSAPVKLSATAMGASLTGVTVPDTVAVSVVMPSERV